MKPQRFSRITKTRKYEIAKSKFWNTNAMFRDFALSRFRDEIGLWKLLQQPAQKGDSGSDVGEAIVSCFALDGQATGEADLVEDAEQEQPVDGAVAERDLHGGPAGRGRARILGMGVDDPALQVASALVTI